MTDSSVDYYAVLDIPRRADTAEVIRAYRRQLRRVHPDTRSVDGEPVPAGEALALLREAFAVLGDPVRRATYDRRTRSTPAPSHPVTPPPRRDPYLAGPPDPPLRAGPVHYRPSTPPGGDR